MSGGGRYFKKRRTTYSQDEPAEEDAITTLIYEVGEKTKASVESSIEGIAKMLETDLATQKVKILQVLTEVVTVLPEKCTIYSTLVGLLNAKNYNFGGEFIESVIKSFKEYVRQEQWLLAQYCLRFISDLVNCHVVSATSLLQLFDTFMDAALDPNLPQVRRDWLVYSILNSLPWVGRELYDKKEQTVERLMITIDKYMKRRNTTYKALLRVWSSDEPHPQEEYLECLWAQIEKLKMDGWTEKHIARPYLAFDSVLCEALQHNLPQFGLPPHQPQTSYPMPTVVFRMFDYTDCPEGPVLPGAHSIERYLIEQELKAILRKHHEDRKECVAALLEHPHAHRVPVEYMIIEVIFGELFKLPLPEYLQICYSSILLEMSKKPGSLFPQVLAQATELLFERLDTMNVSCVDRFITWFAYHLSNNQFRWSWEDWSRVLTLNLENPKPKFITEVIQKCIRLSYHDRIIDLIPRNFQPLLPVRADPCYKFDSEAGVRIGMLQATELQAAFREKVSFDQILLILKQVPVIDGDPDSLAIQVFAQTLFMLGSKTITHAHAAIAKYTPLFKSIVKGEEGQLSVLKSAFEVWRNDSQMLGVAVDLLLKFQIVEFGSVANWIFTKEMQMEFTKVYLWEILHMTIRKMNKNVSKLASELSEARQALRHAEMNSSESESEEKNESGEKPEKNIPSEEQVDKLEEKLESAQADQKNLFLIVFQRFIMILSEHIAHCDTDCKSVNTPWYQWTVGRLQEVFMQHSEQVFLYSGTLETLLFTQDLDRNILEIFEQFKCLRA